MTDELDADVVAWVNQVLQEALQDEQLVLRLVERGYLWMEWNPTDRNYLVWMRMGSGPGSLIKLGAFTLSIAPSRFGGNIGLTHLPNDFLTREE
jgi:hypothetical protein